MRAEEPVLGCFQPLGRVCFRNDSCYPDPAPGPPALVLTVIQLDGRGVKSNPTPDSTHQAFPDLVPSVLQFDRPTTPTLLPKGPAPPAGSQLCLPCALSPPRLPSPPPRPQGQAAASPSPGETLNMYGSLRGSDSDIQREVQEYAASKSPLKIPRALGSHTDITPLGSSPHLSQH